MESVHYVAFGDLLRLTDKIPATGNTNW